LERNALSEAETALKTAKAEEERLPEVLQDLRIQVDTLSKGLQREKEGEGLRLDALDVHGWWV
jgi:signal transduction protein with GAF and PtsI domain